MLRDLKYWKERKVQLRESIVEMVKAYRFASNKEEKLERTVLKARRR